MEPTVAELTAALPPGWSMRILPDRHIICAEDDVEVWFLEERGDVFLVAEGHGDAVPVGDDAHGLMERLWADLPHAVRACAELVTAHTGWRAWPLAGAPHRHPKHGGIGWVEAGDIPGGGTVLVRRRYVRGRDLYNPVWDLRGPGLEPADGIELEDLRARVRGRRVAR